MSKVNRDLFYKLASELPEERLTAAVGIINELQALILPEADEEWKYVLNRLIKGLSSDRNGARLGFSLCLTEVINLAIDLSDSKDKVAPECLPDIDHFLSFLSSSLSPDADSDKKMKGKDERGLLFGKLFGLQSLLNEPLFSKIFFVKKGEISPFTTKFLTQLMDLAQSKNWIREPCLFTLFQTIEKLLPFATDAFFTTLLQLLDEYELTLTNEGLAIYLNILYNNKSGEKINLSSVVLGTKTWKLNDPLARGNLPLLTQVLRDSSQPTDSAPTNVKQKNWNPRLHFVWDIILPIISQPISSAGNDEHVNKKRKQSSKTHNEMINFPEFWQMAIDESFFNEKASSERKYLGFLIFEKAIDLISGKFVPSIFSQNFMRSLINQSTDSKRLLHKISQKALNSIISASEVDSSKKLVPCLDSILFGSNGSINFDKLTKSKTTSKLIAVKELSTKTLIKLFEMFASHIKVDTEEDLTKLHFILDTILHVTRSHRMEITNELSTTILKPIVTLAFFTKDNESINEVAKERLYSILAELTNSANTEVHSWQYYTLSLIIDMENETENGYDLVNQLDDSLLRVKQDAMEILSDISSQLEQTGKDRKDIVGLESLLSMCLLQLYAGDVESISVIEELCNFYNSKIIDGNGSMVGITEILLSLLAQKKAVLKKLSLLAWEQFVSDIKEEELKVLLDVLPARENKQGYAQLFEGVDDVYDEDEEEGEDVEKKSDDEEDSEESDSDSDDDKDEDIENEDIDKIDKEATSALAKALNLPGNMIKENGEVNFDELDDLSGGDDEESDDESMDDEKMMELDDQLSQIFKRRKEALAHIPTGNKRKFEVKTSRESVIAFKHRVVDMLEIYIKHVEKMITDNRKEADSKIDNQTISNVLLFIEPTINCVRETLDKSLADRLSKLLKNKVFKISVALFKDQDSEKCLESIKKIHENLLTNKPGQFSIHYFSLSSTASIFFGKILLENTKKEEKNKAYEQLIDIYCETTKSWRLKGKFGSNVFIDFYNWLASKK